MAVKKLGFIDINSSLERCSDIIKEWEKSNSIIDIDLPLKFTIKRIDCKE